MDCQRCGGEMWTDEGVSKLCGEVFARLCIACLNEWGSATMSSPLWDVSLAVEASKKSMNARAVSGHSPSLAEWESHVDDADRIDRRFRELALEFIKPLPAADTPSA